MRVNPIAANSHWQSLRWHSEQESKGHDIQQGDAALTLCHSMPDQTLQQGMANEVHLARSRLSFLHRYFSSFQGWLLETVRGEARQFARHAQLPDVIGEDFAAPEHAILTTRKS